MIAAVQRATSVAEAAADTYKTQRLGKAAHQFEAMMLSELLKPLSQASEDALNGKDDAAGGGALQSFGMEAVAGALSNSNALGFARQIERALKSTAADPAGLHVSATDGGRIAPTG